MSLRSKSNHWSLRAALTAVAVMGFYGGASAASSSSSAGANNPKNIAESFRSAGLVYGVPSVVTDAAGNATITVPILSQSGAKTLTVKAPAASVAAISATLVRGNLVDWL